MKNRNMFDIENDYFQLMLEIEENEGVFSDEQNEKLTILEGERNKKSLAYLEIINSKESFNARIDEEIKRLSLLKKRNSNIIENLKSRILDAIKMFGEIQTDFVKFSIKKTKSIIVEDAFFLGGNEKYIKEKVTYSADKKAIKEAFKNEEKIVGAYQKVNENLKIN